MKFNIADFHEDLPKKISLGYKGKKISGALHEFLIVFHIADSNIRIGVIQRTHGCAKKSLKNCLRFIKSI